MTTINIQHAETTLSQLLSRVALGEEIVLASDGTPVAKLVPFSTKPNRRSSLGRDKGLYVIPDDFNTPLPAEVIQLFEGSLDKGVSD